MNGLVSGAFSAKLTLFVGLADRNVLALAPYAIERFIVPAALAGSREEPIRLIFVLFKIVPGRACCLTYLSSGALRERTQTSAQVALWQSRWVAGMSEFGAMPTDEFNSHDVRFQVKRMFI